MLDGLRKPRPLRRNAVTHCARCGSGRHERRRRRRRAPSAPRSLRGGRDPDLTGAARCSHPARMRRPKTRRWRCLIYDASSGFGWRGRYVPPDSEDMPAVKAIAASRSGEDVADEGVSRFSKVWRACASKPSGISRVHRRAGRPSAARPLDALDEFVHAARSLPGCGDAIRPLPRRRRHARSPPRPT